MKSIDMSFDSFDEGDDFYRQKFDKFEEIPDKIEPREVAVNEVKK